MSILRLIQGGVYRLLIITLLVLSSCRSQEIIPRAPAPTVYSFSDFKDGGRGVSAWYEMAVRRFDNPVILSSHGGYMGGEWFLTPDSPMPCVPVRTMVQVLKERHPGRPIIITACNPGYVRLDEPGVWHAMGNVWVIPDPVVKLWFVRETIQGFGSVGHLDEFITYDPNYDPNARWWKVEINLIPQVSSVDQ